MKKIFFTFITMLLPMLASAYDAEIDGICYGFEKSDNTAYVTSGIPYSGNIIIPSEVTYNNVTYIVTSIGDGAFKDCRGLTSITIPNSVTYIGGWAFSECSGLTAITIPNSVTTIEQKAFHGTGWYFNQPDGILYLDNWLLGYKGDKPTGAITIADGTKGIATSAFSYCRDLTSVTIPNSVTTIERSVFQECSGLTSVTIPNSVTTIEVLAFSGCTGLKNLIIPNSVTKIADSAFSRCDGLASVTIGSGVTSMGSGVFGECKGLISLSVDSNNMAYDSRENCNAIIETESNTLIVGCMNTFIPNSVTSIGRGAFYGCSGMTSITIPNSVTSIGDVAFDNCSGLTSITIPNSVTYIGGHAFYGCI